MIAAQSRAIEDLTALNAEQGDRIEQLSASNAEQGARIATQAELIAELERRLGRNSRNSSQPPSADGPAAPARRSRRGKTARKQGKQPGSEGKTLRLVDDPDTVIDHVPTACAGRGAGLVDAVAGGWQRRQVHDIPPVSVTVIEHRLHRRQCPCGRTTTAPAPDGVDGTAVYGPGLRAFAVYLLVYQHYLPAVPATHDEVVAFAAWFDDTPRHHQALATVARAHVEAEHPDYLAARRTAENAREDKSASWHQLRNTERHYNMALQHYGNLAYVDDPANRLAQEDAAIAADTTTLKSARDRVSALLREPTLRAQPRETLDLARAGWTAARDSHASWVAARAVTDREASAIHPGGRGVGGVLENLHERPGRGIGR